MLRLHLVFSPEFVVPIPAAQVRIVRLNPESFGDLQVPRYMSAGAAGADIVAAVETSLTLAPGERLAVPTGLALEIPTGWEAQVRPRSGNAFRLGLTVLNAPGTIDSDYRGEVKVLLVNLGANPVTINRGMRIAQLVFAPAPQVHFVDAEALEQTQRGTGGFGSTD
ncbi:MAG TPA: dUTP diphosphatase [Myxococcales bacterium]|nr:dUTP diphosphatase [Myxococcales bacterium]HAN31557.1 dUTP diphosphatase [Myxococcales bacterium]